MAPCFRKGLTEAEARFSITPKSHKSTAWPSRSARSPPSTSHPPAGRKGVGVGGGRQVMCLHDKNLGNTVKIGCEVKSKSCMSSCSSQAELC